MSPLITLVVIVETEAKDTEKAMVDSIKTLTTK